MRDSYRIVQDGTKVLVLKNGMLAGEFTWEGATALANALQAVARKAEEWAKAQQIAEDNALLIRAGVPLGLSDHPDIVSESLKIAQNDRQLRRALPGGIKSKEVFGCPRVIRHDKLRPGTQIIRPAGIKETTKFGNF